ncbi:hypothetical protein [Mycobacteroides saopaulense]|uniref:hypothetical protein n=1 Tax=Mycobacteroides saopaulense TaxID=1578165 RepID=UPI00105431B0|nr:hypothetical protein [Mycobacteroides saopaulense]
MLLAEDFVGRNPWVPGVVSAVVLFLVGTGITLYLRQRDKDSKTLDYRVVSNIAIVTSHERPERLKVIFGKLEVTHPFISQIRFENTGKQVIESTDFLDAVRILRPSAKILDFNIVKESERNLVKGISQVFPIDGGTVQHEVIEIEPGTMNPGDWFEAQILYDGDSGWVPKVSVRILGQTRKMGVYLTKQDRSYLRSPFAALILSSIIGIVGTFTLWITGPSLAAGEVATALLPLAVSVAALGLASYIQYKQRRKTVWARAVGLPKSEPS